MTADTRPDNRLFEWYRRYVGDPEAETDVYLGFALFFGGIALGAVGIVVFLLSAAVGGDPTRVFALREVAVVAAAGGFPALLLGIVVLLPGDRRMTYASLAGAVVCGAALALFVHAYPWHWNVDRTPDYSAEGVAVYAVGLVAVVGATGAALVGHQVARAAGSTTSSAASSTDSATDEDAAESVSEADVRRDIDEAMAGADVSWGGVEKRETKRLNLNTEAVDDVDRTNVGDVSAKTTRAEGVDDAVSGLQGLRGGQAETESGGGTDEQAAALMELRERKEAEQRADDERGIAERVRRFFG